MQESIRPQNTTKTPEKSKKPIKAIKIEDTHSHLAEDISPIMICVGSGSDFKNDDRSFPNAHTLEEKEGRIHYIDFYDKLDKLNEKRFLNAGTQTYAISTLDDFDKTSNKFFDCTGIVVTGIDKATGSNVSFMSHQGPMSSLLVRKDEFSGHLSQILKEVQERCRPGTIDAVIFGGKTGEDFYPIPGDKQSLTDFHTKFIKSLSSQVQAVLGFDPIVANGPKLINEGYDRVYYDNTNRRLYLMRPQVNSSLGSFRAGDVVAKKNKNWK